MSKQNSNCEIKAKESNTGVSVCTQMQVVDLAKSDMEYSCTNCTHF